MRRFLYFVEFFVILLKIFLLNLNFEMRNNKE